MNINLVNKILTVGAGILLLAALALWLFLRFMGPSQGTQAGNTPTANTFGTASNVQTNTGSGGNSTNTNQPLGSAVNTLQQKIFEIASGPVAGAVYMQTGMPTTTIARYIMADSGHVFDLAVDVPGAVAKPVSNTTIPGIQNALWAKNTPADEEGSAVLLQYLDNGVIKTVFMGFPSAASTTASAAAVQIRFLPDNIASLAVSPNGNSVAYLLITDSGSTGYIANANGTASRALFTLPLSQVTISWPSPGALLVQSKPDANSPGIAFSVSVKTGAINQLLFAQGLTATVDAAFSTVVYQTTANGTRLSYAHNIATGGDRGLSFQPAPEKCAWSPTATSTLFCAAPVSYLPTNYLDLWHQGLSNPPDSLLAFNGQTGAALALASPGSSDGGSAASISRIGVSPDGKYLLYVTRNDRSLWGVRLSQ